MFAGLTASEESPSIQGLVGHAGNRAPTDLTIRGLGIEQITIDGAGQTRLFEVLADRRLSLSGMTLTGGSGASSMAGGLGGAILNYGTLHVADVRLANNTALDPNPTHALGGVIFNEADATLTVTGATFENNRARGGGAIYNRGIADIANSEFLGNSTAEGSSGGAIHSRGDFGGQGRLTVADSRFEGNISGNHGAGIYSTRNDELIVRRSTFLENLAAQTSSAQGGAIYVHRVVDVTIEASTFADNRADGGGAVSIVEDSRLHLSDSVFTGNVPCGMTSATAAAARFNSSSEARARSSTARSAATRRTTGAERSPTTVVVL